MAPLLKLLTLVDSLLCFFLPRLWCWTESTRYHWPKEDDRILTLNFDSWFSGEGKEQCHCQLMTCNDYCGNRKLKQRRQRRQRERQKTNRFRLVKQQLCTCITLFCTFLCRHCTANIWRIEQNEMSAIRCEAARLHFVIDVFVTGAVAVA